MEQALAKSEEVKEGARAISLWAENPDDVIKKGQEIAKKVSKIVEKCKLYVEINKKKYVCVEGWQTMGTMLGVFPYIEWTKPIKDGTTKCGYEARAVIKTVKGDIISAGESECRVEENRQKDAYAIRSMAQTRAVSKAFRLAMSWVMTLAKYEPTPAEEITLEMKEELEKAKNHQTKTSQEQKTNSEVKGEKKQNGRATKDDESLRRQIKKKVDELGLPYETVSGYISQKYGKANSKELTSAELVELLNTLEQIANGEVQLKVNPDGKSFTVVPVEKKQEALL